MSFQQGLSGLNAAAKNLDVIGNNVANSNTAGFKQGVASFGDVFAASLGGGGGVEIGIGTQISGVGQQFSQGNVTVTNNPLDIAINGKGFFRMSDGGTISYTRNGGFSLDKNGYIVNENGMFLTGYQPSLNGNEITDDLIKNNGLLRMPDSNLPGNATSSSTLSAMLDSTSTAFTKTANVAFDPTQATYNNKTTQTIFDNSGNSHT